MYITSDAEAIAHHPLTDAQLAPASSGIAADELPLPSKLLLFDIVWYGLSLWPVKSAILILSCPSSLGSLLCMALAQ